MLKVEPVLMQILGTGKSSAGFTLLEILAVLILLGLVTVLATPNVFLATEKIEVMYIGKLITSDLKLAREEAQSNRTVLKVDITSGGYSLPLGSTAVSRDFTAYQFQFVIPQVESDETEESQAIPTEQNIIFAKDGSCEGVTIQWQTAHFQGNLVVGNDGAVGWDYGEK